MTYQSEKGNFTIALAGDTMLTRKLTPFKEERFLKLREILRSADASFANLEGTVHNWDEGTPGITQGTFMTTEPALLDELKWLGINSGVLRQQSRLRLRRRRRARQYQTSRRSRNRPCRQRQKSRRSARSRLSRHSQRPCRLGCRHCDVSTLESSRRTAPRLARPARHQSARIHKPPTASTLRRSNNCNGLTKDSVLKKASNGRANIFTATKKSASANAAELNLLGNRYVLGEGFAITTEANQRDLRITYAGSAKRAARPTGSSSALIVMNLAVSTLLTASNAGGVGRDRRFRHQVRAPGDRRRRRHFRRPWLAFPYGYGNL